MLHRVGSNYSSSKMMRGPINIRHNLYIFMFFLRYGGDVYTVQVKSFKA